jgi:hypothetical protein
MPVSPQDAAPPAAAGTSKTPAPTTDHKIDCSGVSSPLGCKSYNEMVEAKDADLLSLLKQRDVYVCFREYEDVFSVIGIDTPYDYAFRKLPNGTYHADSSIMYLRFKAGQNESFRMVFGKWTKIGADGNPFFATPPRSDTSASVTDSEVSLSYDFRNVGGGLTTYSFQMRRSTLRASETLQWNNPPTKEKAAPDRGSQDYDGHCVLFH